MVEGLSGKIISKNDPNYEVERRDKNLYFSYYPKAIVYPNNVDDVINAVNYAREHKINIRCRNGGHNYESFSVGDDVLVIDMSNLLDFEIDTERGYVKIGAGHTQEKLFTKIADYGFALAGGCCGTVGMTGITLGGGIGFLQREHGLACDNLVEVEMVDAFGNFIIANSSQNVDLLAALRGAGSNNFGVVVSLTFKIHPLNKVTVISAQWPISKRYELVKAFQKVGEKLENKYTIKVILNDVNVSVFGVGLRSTEKEMEEVLNNLLKIPDKNNYSVNTIDYTEYIKTTSNSDAELKAFKTTGLLVYKTLEKAACEIIFDYLDNSPSQWSDINIGLLLLGGKISENKDLPSAYPHRAAKIMLQIDAQWSVENNMHSEDIINWLNSLRKELIPHAGFGYLNYCDINVPNYLYNYFGDNINWLKMVKRKYDPNNLFFYEQGIKE